MLAGRPLCELNLFLKPRSPGISTLTLKLSASLLKLHHLAVRVNHTPKVTPRPTLMQLLMGVAKPHKPGRSPADLRPLGLQDPSSKIVAAVVREKLLQHTGEYLKARPQYAYTPGKAIDEA